MIEADLPAIMDIGHLSNCAGWSTADTQPITVAGRGEWFRKFDPAGRPIWVAEKKKGRDLNELAALYSFGGSDRRALDNARHFCKVGVGGRRDS